MGLAWEVNKGSFELNKAKYIYIYIGSSVQKVPGQMLLRLIYT